MKDFLKRENDSIFTYGMDRSLYEPSDVKQFNQNPVNDIRIVSAILSFCINYEIQVICTGVNQKKASNSLLKLFKSYINAMGLEKEFQFNKYSIRHKENNSIIRFKRYRPKEILESKADILWLADALNSKITLDGWMSADITEVWHTDPLIQKTILLTRAIDLVIYEDMGELEDFVDDSELTDDDFSGEDDDKNEWE